MKGNQSDLQEEIATAFNEPILPLKEWQAPPEVCHGRIDHRRTATLPVKTLSKYMRKRWPSIQSIVRIVRKREHVTQVRQFERYSEVTSTVKSSVFNGLYDLELLVHEIFVITHMDHKAIDTR